MDHLSEAQSRRCPLIFQSAVYQSAQSLEILKCYFQRTERFEATMQKALFAINELKTSVRESTSDDGTRPLHIQEGKSYFWNAL